MDILIIFRLNRYSASMALIKKILVEIAIIMVLGMLMLLVAEQLEINDHKHSGMFAGLMLLIMALTSLLVFKPFQRKGMDLIVQHEQIVIIERKSRDIIATINRTPEKFKKAHFLYTSRYGRYLLPALIMECNLGKTYSVAVMSSSFRWTIETPAIPKPDFIIDVLQWPQLTATLEIS